MSQRTGQNSRKKRNEMETSNLPDSEFKTLIIRMLNEFRGQVHELSENFNKKIESVKKNQ